MHFILNIYKIYRKKPNQSIGRTIHKNKMNNTMDKFFDANTLFLKVIHELVSKNEDLNAIIPYINRLRENLMLSADEVEKLVKDVSENPLVTMFQHEIFQNRTDSQFENAKQKELKSKKRKVIHQSSSSTEKQDIRNHEQLTNNTDSEKSNDSQHKSYNKRKNPNDEECAFKTMKRRKMENRLRKTINDVPLQIQQVVVPPDNKPIKTGVWTEEESTKCHEAYKKYLDYSKCYMIIAKCVGGTRTIKQVRDHIGKIRRRKEKKVFLGF